MITTTEWKVLNWAARISSSMSIIGASTVIFIILRGAKEKLQRIHNRIILNMCIITILLAIALGASTNAYPRELEEELGWNVGAIGTDATCTAQGFFVVFGCALPLYLAMLCVYYLAVIKYEAKDETMERYEPYMHAFCIGTPLIHAIFGVVLDLYHPRSRGYCSHDNGCEIYEYLQTVTQTMASSSLQQNRTSDSEDHSSSFGMDMNFTEEAISNINYLVNECTPRPQKVIDGLKFGVLAFGAATLLIIVLSMSSIYFYVRAQSQTMEKYTTFRRPSKGQNNQTELHKPRTADHETFIQAMLYIASFASTCILPIIGTAVTGGDMSFAYLLIRNILYPLDGLWICITYIRPRFILIRDKKRSASFWWVLGAVLFGGDDGWDEQTTNVGQASKNNKGAVMSKRNSKWSVLERDNEYEQKRKLLENKKSNSCKMEEKKEELLHDEEKQNQNDTTKGQANYCDVVHHEQPPQVFTLVQAEEGKIHSHHHERAVITEEKEYQNNKSEQNRSPHQKSSKLKSSSEQEPYKLRDFTSMIAEDVLTDFRRNFLSTRGGKAKTNRQRRLSLPSLFVSDVTQVESELKKAKTDLDACSV